VCDSDAIVVANFLPNLPHFVEPITIQSGEVSERLNELASKASVGETQPGVRIPPSPPFFFDESPQLARLWNPERLS
jgi:hypothetical protein